MRSLNFLVKYSYHEVVFSFKTVAEPNSNLRVHFFWTEIE